MARCPVCEGIIPAGSNCLVDDTACFDINGDGSEETPFVVDVDFSADLGNLAVCGNDGLGALLPTSITNPPSTQVYNGSNQSVLTATTTTLSFNSELYDTDTMHSIVSNQSRLTFTTAGVYAITVNLGWSKRTTGYRLALIRKNGTDILMQDTKNMGDADLIVGHSLALVDNFAATDYIEVRVHQTSGGTLRLQSESYSPFMTATRLA